MKHGTSKSAAKKMAVVHRAKTGHALQVRSAEGRSVSKINRIAAASALKAAR